jgi:hypothetical protein
MSFINKLEPKFKKFAIPNLTYYLIAGQVIVFILSSFRPESLGILLLKGNNVLSGEVWRIFTFLFFPITTDYFWSIFVWYLYYLYGTGLEKNWGAFRYNLYVFLSVLGTVVASFIFPDLAFTNIYLYTSIFLAFSYLYPDFTLHIFLILPVKVKWLAYLAWGGMILSFFGGSLSSKILVLISVANFLIFFGKDLFYSFRLRARGKTQKSGSLLKKEKPDHVCVVCKKNEISDPNMEIRYCNKCNPESCYCEKHINKHKHIGKK